MTFPGELLGYNMGTANAVGFVIQTKDSVWRRFLVWLFPRQYSFNEWHNDIIGWALEDSGSNDTVRVQLG